MESLEQVIGRYEPRAPSEAADVARLGELIATGGDAWSRSSPLHVTGSALVVHPLTRRVLLRWHERQQAWIQVGGHADPDERSPLSVALREAAEETGLHDLGVLNDGAPLHVVIVDVPASAKEPAHEHADIRFLLSTDGPDSLQPEDGAPLRWCTFAEASALTGEHNVRELLARVERLLK